MRAGFWAAAATMIAMAGLLAVDGATNFAAAVRPIVYGLAMAAGAVTVGAALLAGRVQVLPPMCVVRLIEQVRPDLKNALLTFVELRSDPSADPSKIAAVARRAARILAEVDLCEFVPTVCVRRATYAAMGGACLLGVMLWLTQGVLFSRGPATAKAELMIASGSPLASAAQTQAGAAKSAKTPADPEKKPGSEAAAQSLAAAMEADKENLQRLAEALAGKPDGAGRAPSAGIAGRGAGDDGAGRGAGGQAPSGDAAGCGANQQAPSAGQAVRASSGSSGARPNEERRLSADTGSSAAPAPSAGGAGRGASEQGPSAGNAPLPEGQASIGPGGAQGDGATKPPPAQASAPPLPKRPQSDALPEKTLDAMRKVRRSIDEADKRLREGEVTDAFLGRMGMSNAEFRRFVAAWQRQLDTAAPETSAAPPGARQAPGEPMSKVEFSTGGAGTDVRPITGPAPAAAAIQGGAVQGADASASVRLRPAVAAYFETVGKLAAEKAEAKATP
jgi:hypothetical protein